MKLPVTREVITSEKAWQRLMTRQALNDARYLLKLSYEQTI